MEQLPDVFSLARIGSKAQFLVRYLLSEPGGSLLLPTNTTPSSRMASYQNLPTGPHFYKMFCVIWPLASHWVCSIEISITQCDVTIYSEREVDNPYATTPSPSARTRGIHPPRVIHSKASQAQNSSLRSAAR